MIAELEKSSGKKSGKEFGVHANPEFLREGSALHDFDNTPFVVIGSVGGDDGCILEELSEGTGSVFRTNVKTAETLKYI